MEKREATIEAILALKNDILKTFEDILLNKL